MIFFCVQLAIKFSNVSSFAWAIAASLRSSPVCTRTFSLRRFCQSSKRFLLFQLLLRRFIPPPCFLTVPLFLLRFVVPHISSVADSTADLKDFQHSFIPPSSSLLYSSTFAQNCNSFRVSTYILWSSFQRLSSPAAPFSFERLHRAVGAAQSPLHLE